MPTWSSLYFQNSASSVMEQLIFFHDHVMVILVLVMILVGYLLFSSCFNYFYNLNIYEGQELESIWTILPVIFLLLIAFPSLRLLYLMEEMNMPEVSIKIMGHQWFWSYEYSDVEMFMFESFMLPFNESLMYRLINVDNSLILPFGSNIRLLVSSMDVIHSWALPSVGVKVDAIPGRLNQILLMFNRIGLYIGQCSEICGANHSFMPIYISVIPKNFFLGLF